MSPRTIATQLLLQNVVRCNLSDAETLKVANMSVHCSFSLCDTARRQTGRPRCATAIRIEQTEIRVGNE